MIPSGPERRRIFRAGQRAILPSLPGAAAWGLVSGVAMVKGGLTVPWAIMMSLLVYAGSAQLAALPRKAQIQIARKIDLLRFDTQPPGSKRLEGGTGLFRLASGDYRIVMMNDDGSPGVSAETQFGVEVEGLRGLAVGAAVAGVLLLLVGLGLLIWGIFTRRSPPRAPTHAPAPTVP